jgi:hypothetical protein
MRTKKFLQWPVIAGFAILFGCFFLVSATLLGKKTIAVNKNASGAAGGDNKIWRIIKAADLKKALEKSKSKNIMLNIYPVKFSNSPKKKDFDLMIYFQDGIQLIKDIGSKAGSKVFEAQSASYISFLKSKEIPMNKIPFGYYIKIDMAFIQGGGDLDICVLPEKSQMLYCQLPKGNKSDASLTQPTEDDSTGKCPPECCIDFLRVPGDSTGKCPPECPVYSLLFEKDMKKIIADAYKK